MVEILYEGGANVSIPNFTTIRQMQLIIMVFRNFSGWFISLSRLNMAFCFKQIKLNIFLFFQMKTCPGERLECPLLHQSNGQFDIKM